MFVHVTCEHVRHDYAPIYTIDVASPNNICTEQIVALDTTEDIGLFVLCAIQYINFRAWTCCSLWFVEFENIANFKDLEFKGFYFYNCFDTDCKKYSLVGYGYFILYNLMEWKKQNDNYTRPERVEKQQFFLSFVVSVLHHPFFFVLLLIRGLWAFSYQCNKILKYLISTNSMFISCFSQIAI